MKKILFTVLISVSFVFVMVLPSKASSELASCPASAQSLPVPSELSQKFPIDLIVPNGSEQGFFSQAGDGCFQINSGLEFQRICLPGMIVNALQPFLIVAAGIKFIFSD